jgi:Zn finger protein HypA/HybF involved in hydrogenase expression
VCPEIQRQVRCRECNRRLGDYVNEIQAGQVILELKCPKCGRPHAEIIRHWEQDLPRSKVAGLTRSEPTDSPSREPQSWTRN